MGKYSEQTKLAAVESCYSGKLGLKTAAQLHNVEVSSLRKWLAAYKLHGLAGIREKRRQAYSLEFKLTVLQRIRDEGLSLRQAGALFDIRKFDIIGEWEETFERAGIAGLTPYQTTCRRRGGMTKKTTSTSAARSRDDETRTRQELIRELNFLRTENAYLKKLAALVQAKAISARSKGR